jgi:acetolactate synthase-1/2/3 large subunit
VPAVIDCPVDYRENFLFSQKSKALDCHIAEGKD